MIALGLALCLLFPPLCFTLVTLLSLRLLWRRPVPPAPDEWPAIALLRPCQGAEPSLHENLLSSVRAHYQGPRRVLFLVPDPADPAHDIAVAAARESGGRAEVVVTGDAAGGNRKVAQLCVGESLTREEVLVQADSDVLLGDADLPALVSALYANDRYGAAFASPIEIGATTLADRASAALCGASHQNFMALYALSSLSGGVPSLAGALCAFRRSALLHIGGLSGLRPYLGEDHEVARRLRQAGHTIALSRQPARCTDSGRSARAVISRVARWMMVVRCQRPGLLLSYPLLLAAIPPCLLVTAMLRSPVLLALTLLLVLLRMALALALRRAQGVACTLRAALCDVFLAEGLMWLALVRAVWNRRIEWRGHRYRIGRGGVLMPD